MKTAFAIDFLLERTPEVFLLELLLAGHEDADIYCLAHAQGQILGTAERHRIISSPLSRFVQKTADLEQKAWLIPSALKQLHIAPNVERLVVISSGWAHTFASSPQTKRYTWMYEWENTHTRLRGLKKLFSPYHRQLKELGLDKEEHLAFSSQTLATELGKGQAKVIAPALKTEEFPMVSDEEHPGEYTHHLVLLDGAAPTLVRKLITAARERQIPLRVLGPDGEYAFEKSLQVAHVEFVGDHCEATTAALTHGARAVWSLGHSAFPAGALGAQCCGRPVVVLDLPENHEFLGDTGTWYLRNENQITELLNEVEATYLNPDRKILRRQGLKWNERLFKSQMREFSGVVSVARPSALLN